MIDEHTEIEAKFDAASLWGKHKAFERWIFENYEVERYKFVSSPDTYYTQGENVVRQRGNSDDPNHELTVKRRRSGVSTRDRLEIDLTFSPDTSTADVTAFLEATGFVKAFTLWKRAWIFWVRLTENVTASFALYSVEQVDGNLPGRLFVECEIEKGSDVTPDTAKRHLRTQIAALQQRFGFDEPMNVSLWEIFSGKRYQQE